MRGSWAAGIAALAALAAWFAVVAVAPRSGPALRVAFVTGSATTAPEVWLAPLRGGPARRIGEGSQPLLAPNGSLVAASAPSGLALYSSTGDAPRRYFVTPDATAVAAAFSPDSRYLAVVLQSTDPAGPAYSGLAVIDTRTFTSRIIVRGQIDGAGFAPETPDRIAYASAPTAALAAPVNISVILPTGTGARRITSDGRSLNPVWGRRGIAFDHERLRHDAEPAYEVWLMAANGSDVRSLTSLTIPRLREGLVPTAVSGDGGVLLADYEGQDTERAWLVQVPGGRATSLGADLTGAGVARNGARVLVDRGGFLNPPDRGVVESLPVAEGHPAGRPRVLAPHGSEPSWND